MTFDDILWQKTKIYRDREFEEAAADSSNFLLCRHCETLFRRIRPEGQTQTIPVCPACAEAHPAADGTTLLNENDREYDNTEIESGG